MRISRSRILGAAAIVAVVVAIGFGVRALVQNSQIATDVSPTANGTTYVTPSAVVTIEPTDATARSTATSPPTLAPTLPPLPPPPSLRFHPPAYELFDWPRYRFASLNESDIISLYGLNLSDYRFPEDYPFTIRDGAVHLKVPVDNKIYYLRTGFSQEAMQHLCTPSDDARRLLCTIHSSGRGDIEDDLGISGDDVDALIEQLNSAEAEGAVRGRLHDALFYKRHFIIARDLPDIYVLPGEGKDGSVLHNYRTYCLWFNDTKIECVTSGGTSFDTTLFDLGTEMYTELPGCCGNNMDVFESFYLQPCPAWRYNLYNLNSEPLLPDFLSLANPIVTENAIAFVGLCENPQGDFSDPLCFYHLETDGQVFTREVKLDLSAYTSEDCKWAVVDDEKRSVYFTSMPLHRIPSMYLVTACDKAFFIPVDDLQIAEVVDLPSAEYGDAVYGYGDFVVTQLRSRTTVFDLRQCEGVLDEACVSKSWAGSIIPLGLSVKGRGERSYRTPAFSPSLLFISAEGALRIYDLDTQREVILEGQLFGVSEDGSTVLISKGETYRLFDLENWRIVEVRIIPGKDLILARDGV